MRVSRFRQFLPVLCLALFAAPAVAQAQKVSGGQRARPAKRGKGMLVLVRHGQSRWNRTKQFTGWTDVGLTNLGRREARDAGKQLRGTVFDRAFTSRLRRAGDTLSLLLGELGGKRPSVVKSSALNERHYGRLQGMNKDRAKERYGAAQVKRWQRGYADRPPGGESLKDTAERVVPFVEKHVLPEVRKGGKVLVTAHGNSLRALRMHLERLSPAEVESLEIPTGVPTVYEVDGDGRLRRRE